MKAILTRIERAKTAIAFPIFYAWANLALAQSAGGGGTIGTIADTVVGSVKSVSRLVVWAFLALGIYFVGKGIMEFRQAGDPQHASQFNAGASAAKVAVGGLLLALSGILAYITGTFGLGTDSNVNALLPS